MIIIYFNYDYNYNYNYGYCRCQDKHIEFIDKNVYTYTKPQAHNMN